MRAAEIIFSVVTPVLNGMPFLRGCVGSVRNQRPIPIEHLVQDAGSTDGTREWLAQQADLDVEYRPDAGMYDALNRGWARARGHILSWLNADEQYLPGTLERVQAYLQAHPDTDAVFGDYLIVGPDGHALAARREIPLRRWYVVNGVLYAMSCALFVRRRVFETHGGFDVSYRDAGDADWVLRLLQCKVRFDHMPGYLSLFVFTGRNSSQGPNAAAERDCLRRQHGAHSWALARAIPRLARTLEKLLCGCYGRQTVRYCFRVDETRSKWVEARVGTRWPRRNLLAP